MLTICLTFLATTGLYALPLWFACRRVSRHLAGNAQATSAVVEHLLLPLLGRQGLMSSSESQPSDSALDNSGPSSVL